MLLASSRWSSKARFLTWQAKPLFSTRVTEFNDTDKSRPSPSNVSAVTLRVSDIPSNRYLFQLAPSEPPTEEIECLLLQTPTAVQTDESPEKMRERAERNGYKNGTKYGSLTSQIKYDQRCQPFLKTPCTADSYTDKMESKGVSGTSGTLAQEVVNGYAEKHRGLLLPTPLAVEREHPERVEALKATGATRINSRANGESRPNGLLDFMNFYDMLPTPNTGVYCNSGGSEEFWENRKEKGRQTDIAMAVYDWAKENNVESDGGIFRLSPLFTEEMMGFPLMWTTLPFLSQNGAPKVSKPTATPSSPK